MERGLKASCLGLGEHNSFQLNAKSTSIKGLLASRRWGDRLLLLNELIAQTVSSWGARGGFQGKVNTVVSSSWLPVITQAQGRENELIKMSKQVAVLSRELQVGLGVGSGHSQSPGEPPTSFPLMVGYGPRRSWKALLWGPGQGLSLGWALRCRNSERGCGSQQTWVQVLVLQSDLGRVTRTFGAWVSPSVK